MTGGRPWATATARGPAADLHEASAALVASGLGAARPERGLRVLEATTPAVVLGSAEPDGHVDRDRARARGVAVARRRSGGSAVIVGPGQALWVDVVVPSDDPLWDADVGRAAWWLGRCWAGAFADVGIPGAEVWEGPMVHSFWSARVCFAGLGPGEVTIGGTKVVGISQRRTRAATLLQCAVPVGAQPPPCGLRPWDPSGLLDVLDLSPDQRQQGALDLAGAAAAVPAGPVLVPALVAALVARCERAGSSNGLPSPPPSVAG